MAMKKFIIRSPEELIDMYMDEPEGNESMMNLARVWRAERAKGRALTNMAELRVGSKKNAKAKVVKIIGKERVIGLVDPVNAARFS